MELKAKGGAKDWEEFNFDPKVLLSQICEIYTILVPARVPKAQGKNAMHRFIS